MPVAHAYCPLALEHDFSRQRLRTHGQVRPSHGRSQEGTRRAHAPATVDRALRVGDAFLPGAVVVGVAGNSDRNGALDERVAERMTPVDVGDDEAAILAAENVVAVPHPALGALEVGQHIGVSPAAVAPLRPTVVVHALAAIVDVAVDGRGAAERLAARRSDGAAACPLADLHLVKPVHARVDHGVHEARRYMDEGAPVAPPRLQNANAGLAVLAQAVGEHGARGARADDDVIEGIHLRPAPFTCWLGRSIARASRSGNPPRWQIRSRHAERSSTRLPSPA